MKENTTSIEQLDLTGSADDHANLRHSTHVGQRSTLALLAVLFFAWGFIQVLNNTLVPHLRNAFDLSYAEAGLIGFVWFIAYSATSVPAANLIRAKGYQKSVVIGLSTMSSGAFMTMVAAEIPSFALMLSALFVTASGVTVLQVAANPYVAVAGPVSTASSRLNLVQAFNSLGSTLAPVFGGWLILSPQHPRMAQGAAMAVSQAERLADARFVVVPYLAMGVVLAALAMVFARARLPKISVAVRLVARGERGSPSLWHHRNLVWGVPAIFAYMIAEVGSAAFFINFVERPDIGNITQAEASTYLFLLWAGMMVGRFIGSALMRRIAPEQMLASACIFAFVALISAVFGSGRFAMWSLISVGLFHSIMFPTIFTLSIRNLGPFTEAGSGLLIMAVGGGALVVVQGWLADAFGPQVSFLLPATCEIYILIFALWAVRAPVMKNASSTPHTR